MARQNDTRESTENSPADAEPPDPAATVFETDEWPDSLLRSDEVCPLPHDPERRRRRPFSDWADL